MANNLFITYDLIKTKDYAAVYDAIKSLGNWALTTESNWYVNCSYSAEDAAKIVRAVMVRIFMKGDHSITSIEIG
ncbi:hypothetical protein AB2G54_00130 [Escherichia coli]